MMVIKSIAAVACFTLFRATIASAGEPNIIAANSVILWVQEDGRVLASGAALPHRGDDDPDHRKQFRPVEGLRDIVSVDTPRQDTDSAAALDRHGRVWLWGDQWHRVGQAINGNNQVHVPRPHPDINDAVALAMGGRHLVILHREGTVSTVGSRYDSNSQGQMGTGSKEKASGVYRIPTVTDAVAVAANADATLILRKNGTILGAGSTTLLGKRYSIHDLHHSDESDLQQLTFQPIPGMKGVRQIVLGTRFAAALDVNGQVWGWGSNHWGELGLPADENNVLPPRRLQGLQDIVAIAAGDDFLLCIDKDQTVQARGCNIHATLGDQGQELAGRLRRIRGLDGITQVWGGAFNAFAKRSDGTFWGWGHNDSSGFSPSAPDPAVPPVKIAVPR